MTHYLEHYPERGGPAEFVPITGDRFIIGRSRSAHLTIYSQKVSKEHAAIVQSGGSYLVRDLGSTNGTFVNGKRVEETSLQDGDIIHISHWEFCYCSNPHAPNGRHKSVEMTQQTDSYEKESLIRNGNLLQQLVHDESVTILFQPIVDLRTGETVGFEALGRGNHHQLHQSPIKLFELAEKCQMATHLCRLFRTEALKRGVALPARFPLFLNIHPSEFGQSDFIRSLVDLTRKNQSNRQLVIEVSEQSVTNVVQMREIQSQLDGLGIEFAYDDFGAGQSRLLELAECSPHFLKLDRSLVKEMGRSASSRDFVRALVAKIVEKGIKVIGEGIETRHEADTCLECGCELGQGFLFGRPSSALEIIRTLGRGDSSIDTP